MTNFQAMVKDPEPQLMFIDLAVLEFTNHDHLFTLIVHRNLVIILVIQDTQVTQANKVIQVILANMNNRVHNTEI